MRRKTRERRRRRTEQKEIKRHGAVGWLKTTEIDDKSCLNV
jgi:hypothetical protein